MEPDSIDDTSLIHKLESEAGTTSGNGGLLSDREYRRARTLISDTEKVLISLDQEIQRLIAMREEVAERLSRFQFAAAPYKRLPPEVLSDIFVWTLDGLPVVFPPVNNSGTPWILRQICSSWRQVALSEPRLWNNSRIVIRTPHPELPLIVKLYHSVIPPTGPLSIRFSCHIDIPSEHVADELLIPHISRIKHLDLDTNFHTFGRLLKIRCQDFSNLETLLLRIRGPLNSSTMSEQCRSATVFQSAHLLRHLTLSSHTSNRFANNMLHIPFPWVGLTSLRINWIRPFTLSDIQHLLLQCTSLIDLEASVYYDSPPQDNIQADTALRLSYLRLLRIAGEVIAPHSLPSLQLPWDQLIELDLISFDFLDFSETHAILSHSIRAEKIRISSPQIQSLSSTHLPLITLPKLKDLRILCFEDASILDYLVVPAIELLDLECPGTLAESKISDMIIRASCSLSSFIFNCPDVDPRDLCHLLTLMPLLHHFDAKDSMIDQQVISCISTGELLPQLVDLTCLFEMPFVVPCVTELEMWRTTPTVMSDGACSTIPQRVWDICFNYGGGFEVQNAFERFRELHEEHGTRFNLVL
ncbi:hypothetical protein FPV67DRAFT_224038 [Lyophyllum atratum]|nr:hypothetical protein FPV67DRAFT_224038 [Lyophyllum atratum]